MRALVLGSTGFLGRLAVRELSAAGHEVEAWARGEADDPARGKRRVDLTGGAPLPAPAGRVDAALLCAGPAVPARFVAEREGAAAIAIATRALDHLARHAPGARLVVVSSAHVLAPADDALDEDAPVDPRGDYGAAKARIETLASAARGLDVVVVRIFGSLGPGLPAGLLVPDLCARLARGEAPLRLAGRDGRRDWTDGRDVARALRLVLEARRGADRVLHLGTGRATTVRDLAERLARAAGSTARIELAPGVGPGWIADPRRLAAATGWAPRHDLADTLDWIVRESALAPRRTSCD